MKKLIMTDLDNTLLPVITQEDFVDIWFRDVAKKFFEHGMDQYRGLEGVNAGCRAMIFNDGSRSNFVAFYTAACETSGFSKAQLDEVMTDYYDTAFDNVRAITRKNPYAPGIARLMRKKAAICGVATMPMFPLEAVERRMRWTGLDPAMFDFITTFDTSSYCKPNPDYFREILDRTGTKPADVLMIGNDVREDIIPAQSVGIETFLVTDHMITHGLEYADYRQGSYPDLIAYLESI